MWALIRPGLLNEDAGQKVMYLQVVEKTNIKIQYVEWFMVLKIVFVIIENTILMVFKFTHCLLNLIFFIFFRIKIKIAKRVFSTFFEYLRAKPF